MILGILLGYLKIFLWIPKVEMSNILVQKYLPYFMDISKYCLDILTEKLQGILKVIDT